MAECASCKGTATMVLCWPCGKAIRNGLVELPWYLDRLAESAYGEARTGRAAAKVSTGERLPSLPLNMRASDLLREIADALHGWNGGESPMPPGMVAWSLAREVGALMSRDDAAEVLAELRRLRAEAEVVVDLPPDMQYVGLCHAQILDEEGVPVRRCDTRLYCERGDSTVKCPRCGSSSLVGLLQAAMLDRVDETLRSQAEMWRLLKWIGRDVPRSSFYRLVASEVPCRAYRLADGSLTTDETLVVPATPVYAYSDVVAVLDAREAADAERRAAGRRGRGRPRKPACVDVATEGS